MIQLCSADHLLINNSHKTTRKNNYKSITQFKFYQFGYILILNYISLSGAHHYILINIVDIVDWSSFPLFFSFLHFLSRSERRCSGCRTFFLLLLTILLACLLPASSFVLSVGSSLIDSIIKQALFPSFAN